jgi:hypothetical protein
MLSGPLWIASLTPLQLNSLEFSSSWVSCLRCYRRSPANARLLGAELFFWQLYKDEFIFLWYKDPMRTMIGWEIPLKCLRAVFVFSALWLIGRVSIYPFYGGQDNDTLKKAKAQ